MVKSTPIERRYARIPESVLCDEALSPTDKVIYGILSLQVFEGNIACVGQRRIASLARCSRRSIRRSLANLARNSHISVSVVTFGGRSAFQLNSHVFGQFADVGVGAVVRP